MIFAEVSTRYKLCLPALRLSPPPGLISKHDLPPKFPTVVGRESAAPPAFSVIPSLKTVLCAHYDSKTNFARASPGNEDKMGGRGLPQWEFRHRWQKSLSEPAQSGGTATLRDTGAISVVIKAIRMRMVNWASVSKGEPMTP